VIETTQSRFSTGYLKMKTARKNKPKKTKAMEAKYQKYFKAYPKIDEFWFTADGLAFTDAAKAEKHQKSIRGAKGKPVHRSRKDIKPDQAQTTKSK
jgi:hypothetical protein